MGCEYREDPYLLKGPLFTKNLIELFHETISLFERIREQSKALGTEGSLDYPEIKDKIL